MSVRGHDVERAVKARLEACGWLVVRAAGSLGPADLVALRAGERALLLEVKSTARPWERFGPADRAELSSVATRADADALLAWWPRGGLLRFIPEAEWPPAGCVEREAA